jgi:hypothetical protein
MRTLFILILFFSSADSYAQFAEDLRILREDSHSAIIEFVPQYFGPSMSGRNPSGTPSVHFTGELATVGTAGEPVIPFRATNVLFPSHRYTLQILTAEYREIPNLQPSHYPTTKSIEGFIVRNPEQLPERATGRLIQDKKYQHDLIEIIHLVPEAGHVVGAMKFYPVQYSSGGSPAKVYTRIVARLDYDPQPPGRSINPWQRTGTVASAKSVTPSLKGPADSPLAQGNWYRLDVGGTGIYKLDRDFFTKNGISVSGNIQSIRIFGIGGEELPEDLTQPRPNGLVEVTRFVVDKNNDNLFDADDYILFYGKSVRGWKYESQQKTFHHYLNHYAESNAYFLTLGGIAGRAMDSTASSNTPGAYVPSDFQGKVAVEEEQFNAVNSGREWFGRSFDASTRSQTFTTLLSGIVLTKPAIYRFIVASRSTSIDTFTVYENNQLFGNPVYMFPTAVGSLTDDKLYVTPMIAAIRTGDYPNERSVLRFNFGMGSTGSQGWVDWFEILYQRRFEAVGDSLSFTSPDTTALVEYNLNNFSSRDINVFDVSDHQNVRRITNLTFNPADPSKAKFQVPQSAGSVREFIGVGPNGYKSIATATKLQNSNLHGVLDGADFIILSPKDFFFSANRLKTFRERPGVDYLKTLVVDVESVFNEFSNGMPDPTAIRDFLKYASTGWAIKPKYVLMLGGASYDYKDNLHRKQKDNWILPYETAESNNQIDTYSSDDFFVKLDPQNDRASIAIGRFPVRSVEEAELTVSKIIAYETEPFGSWRNRITFVADDGLTSTGDEFQLHTGQAETLAEAYTPRNFDKRKIYLVEYPTVTSSSGRRKPDVNNAIDAAINNGTLIINWTGHGNTKIWAHERVFGDEEDFPKLSNDSMHCLLVAATCDFARWEYPQERSSGEEILVSLRGGAIAVITAIRVVYSDNNSTFNNTLYGFVFLKDSLNRPPRLGDAMKDTKNLLYSFNDQRTSVNTLKYHLLGDPTMRLGVPHATASIDSLGGKSTAQLVPLPTLGRIAVTGEIKQPNGTRASSFNGRALIEVFDSKRQVPVPEWGTFYFDDAGSLLYRGELSVTNGVFQGTFPVPKDVSYGIGTSRVSAYTWSNATDGIGYTDSLRIQGTDSTAVADTTGPQIRVYLDSDSFRPGDFVQPNATLIVELFDQSGMNTSTAGIGHRLEAVLSSRQQPIDLTDFYRGNLDTYQGGKVVYPLTGLSDGRQNLSVRAWDIHNNSSRLDTYFEVRAASDAAIYDVLNFPNPFTTTTMFTFQRNSSEPIDVEIKIYTLAGRLIENLEASAQADRFVQIPWNGRDRDGNELANGVYFYKVITRSLDRQRVNEVLNKLTVLR